MFKKIVIFLIYMWPLLQFAQDFSNLWEGYFSYNKVTDVVVGNNKIYGASENAIFTFDTQTHHLEEITTVNGLSGETISTIYYSEMYELLVIGYHNGLIEIVFDNGEVLSVVDIVNKTTITDNKKKINHITAYHNYIYLSTGYGISTFDLERLEFGDSYFIGNLGAQIEVRQIAIFEGNIYAACRNGGGVKKAPITSPNLIDYKNWETIHVAEFYTLQVVQNKLFAVAFNKWSFEITNQGFNRLFLLPNLPLSSSSIEDKLVITTKNDVFVYDIDFNLIVQASKNEEFSTSFNSAKIYADRIYIGTNDFGILSTSILNPMDYEEIHPDGPLLNIPFSIQAEPNGIWVTYGAYDLFYNPYGSGGLNARGVSHLNNGEWINTKYENVFGARVLNDISVNPNNANQVFISSFFRGMLEFIDDVPAQIYNQTNSTLESLKISNPNYIDVRIGTSTFDQNGILWVTNSKIANPLKSLNPTNNTWVSYDFESLITDKLIQDRGYGDLVVGRDNTKWMASADNGLIGFNENNGNSLIKIIDDDGNLPDKAIKALAIDNTNQLWIGTEIGLRVLYNTSNFFTDENLSADEIIIEEDGIAKELLADQFISDIKVDGSNNKWISTMDSGVFYLSSNGQETIYHFTTDNSPLPSNDVKDISIDETNGLIYFATSKGLVSFKSGGSQSTDDLKTVYAYPNPVRPNFDIVEKKVKIKNISDNVNIKITDIEGNLVAEAQSRINLRYNNYNLEIDGGTVYWNGKNMANNIVASGVYLIMISDLDTFETKVVKLMVIR
ncbi:type IX secretion system anionic LPS delivery protein PorZ [Algibacter pacificus]|uniref:type IX secretion system anionic LPS delivery protein PorZ n=1 Tax=Algibacter pacificus TaxID=2599389 RepID=UPI0011CB21EA|nr:ABC transporter substrate-binding protein [Algibacter pacificus]